MMDTYNLCHQLLYLRNLLMNSNDSIKFYDQYALKITVPLAKTVERSFVQEYRKIQIAFGEYYKYLNKKFFFMFRSCRYNS